mmetsp:Transcript_988/g.2232  ORF Transcript_988/g.2232 Transcript_988/m.2232 type:complete len:125 (-) Transcript_988:1096-1470(-)
MHLDIHLSDAVASGRNIYDVKTCIPIYITAPNSVAALGAPESGYLRHGFPLPSPLVLLLPLPFALLCRDAKDPRDSLRMTFPVRTGAPALPIPFAAPPFPFALPFPWLGSRTSLEPRACSSVIV